MNKLVDYFIGALLAVVLFTIIGGSYATLEHLARQTKNNTPISEWFEATQLYVPDLFVGETNPSIIYDRVIYQPFYGLWTAQVQRIEDKGVSVTCSGNGASYYGPDKVLPAEGITLGWLIGHTCELSAGKYRVEVVWTIQREGYEDKTVTLLSNVFSVS